MKKIILCTGGTGGHIFPMLVLHNQLVKKNSVKFITDIRASKFFDKKIFEIIPSESPFRKKSILHFLKSIIVICYSTIKCFFIIFLYKPDIIVGSGGYVSFPVLLVAKFLKKKFYLYETNSVLGRVNRFFLSSCTKILSGYEKLILFPEKYQKKLFYVGQLVRSEFVKMENRNELFTSFKNNNSYFNILILGGSQGAEIFGEVLPKKFKNLIEKKIKLNVVQQVKENQLDKITFFYDQIKNEISKKSKTSFNFSLFTFSHDLNEYIKKSHLVICRAGSSTISELVNMHKPFIAIPLKNSLDNHQFFNAKYYYDRDCCWLIEEEKNFANQIERIIEDTYKSEILLQNKTYNLIKNKKGDTLNNFINEII